MASTDSAGELRVEVLGPVEAWVDGTRVALGGQRPRALLAVLALMRGRVVSSERLIDELWGEDPPARARESLQMHVSRLRKALTDAGGDADRLVGRAGGYVLELGPGVCDVDRWEAALGRAQRARAAGLLEAARTGIAEALGVWRGAPIAGAGAHGLLDGERARLEEERLAAAIEGLEIDLELGRHGDLVGQLEALVIAHPFKERLVALQMVALYRCGRQSDALEVYTRSRRRLDEELGLEPSSQLRRLEEAILRQDPSLEVAIGEPIPQRQPRALPPSLPAQLQPRPAMPFVGRAAELGRLAALLDRARTGGRSP